MSTRATCCGQSRRVSDDTCVEQAGGVKHGAILLAGFEGVHHGCWQSHSDDSTDRVWVQLGELRANLSQSFNTRPYPLCAAVGSTTRQMY